jgi:NTE family protein
MATSKKTASTQARVPAKKAAAAKATPTGSNRRINLALQGGGSHGAFTWGVIDKLLEDGRLEFDGISGTSAGSMNAVALAYGSIGGNAAARQTLEDFWRAVSASGQRSNPLGKFDMGWMQSLPGGKVLPSMASQWFHAVTHAFSPYQLNPLNINPLRDLLKKQIDFERMGAESKIKLFLAATNVRSGKAKVFGVEERITADMVMASACLPQLFRAVEIEGEHYWDGGFMGNPVLYPLFYHTQTQDVLIVHINPIERPGPPTTAEDILNRVNEITFNSSLIKELRAVHFVQKLMDEGWIKDEYMDRLQYVLMHSIRADLALADLSADSKLKSDWGFLTMLRDRGRSAAAQWLDQNFASVGKRSTVDLKAEFL